MKFTFKRESMNHKDKSDFDSNFKWTRAWDFQQCGILTSVDSDVPVQLLLSLDTYCCSVSSLTLIEYLSD